MCTNAGTAQRHDVCFQSFLKLVQAGRVPTRERVWIDNWRRFVRGRLDDGRPVADPAVLKVGLGR